MFNRDYFVRWRVQREIVLNRRCVRSRKIFCASTTSEAETKTHQPVIIDLEAERQRVSLQDRRRLFNKIRGDLEVFLLILPVLNFAFPEAVFKISNNHEEVVYWRYETFC